MAAERPTVVIATHLMSSRSGTETYTRDLALALLRNDWRVVVYTSRLGAIAEELRRATIPVVDDLDRIPERPDVIHGNHGMELVAAMLRWPDVPALFVTHDALAWHSVPPVVDRIGYYVAVDDNCRDRIIWEHGVDAARVRLLANAVDLARFTPRPPLPPAPTRALVFSNNARESTFVPAIRAACAARGIALDVAGLGADAVSDAPEALLPRYDLVFAKGRCALEAMAAGNAVILCDERGLGTLVGSSDVEHLRRMNFGMRTLQRPIDSDSVGGEIDRYDAADAARVRDTIRAAAGADLLALQLIDLYDELRRRETTIDRDDESRALSRYMTKLVQRILQQADAAASSPSARLLQRVVRSRRLAPAIHRLYRLLGRPT